MKIKVELIDNRKLWRFYFVDRPAETSCICQKKKKKKKTNFNVKSTKSTQREKALSHPSTTMRAKRSKKYRKLMHQYELTFGFREPYQVLGIDHCLPERIY